jgi:hypothetical protein
MHSDLLEQIVRQRTAEVRRSAESGRSHADRGPLVPIRHRAGRTLAAIGLRIAGDSGQV